MSDFEDSDEERYANEYFENETDNEVPEMSEIESETSENSDDNDEHGMEEEIDDDEDDLPSVKLNTGPIRRNSFANNFINLQKTDAVPFASSSDEEDDVIVGQTLAEINTPSMNFTDEPLKPIAKQLISLGKVKNYANSLEEKLLSSSDEISEEENFEDEEEEFKRIQEMEEKYILQNSAKTPKVSQTITQGNQEEKFETPSEGEYESYIEDEEEEREIIDNEDERNKEYMPETNIAHASKELANDNLQNLQTIDRLKEEQNNIVELLENTLTNLKLLTAQNNETVINSSETSEMQEFTLIDENKDRTFDSSNINDTEYMATIEANAPAHSQSTSDKDDRDSEEQTEHVSLNQNNKPDDNGYDALIEQDQEIEVERVQKNSDNVEDYKHNYAEDEDVIYYDNQFDYHITSKTPTSFNSDDYIFHANFIKQFHRTNSTDKLRPKPHPRKSMSFSNERMREIERHNQILLRKILTQKPTYNLKSKPSQTSIQKASTQPNARLTTSAVNRRKQQRQIDLDNQILKKKIEAIAVRRRPLIS